MGFWAKSLRIFNAFCDNTTQSIRQVAQCTGFSKSSVHRLKQAIERRDGYPESWLWETAEGHGCLLRLGVARQSRGCANVQKGMGGFCSWWWRPSIFSASSEVWAPTASASFSAGFAWSPMSAVPRALYEG